MTKTIVGRDAELALADGFLEGIRQRSATLVLAGAAGIGKTTVWEAAVARAEATGMRVLRSRPGASETRLTYAGLLDLVGDVDLTAFPAIPRPLREALDVALLRVDRTQAGADQRSVAAGFLQVLRALSRSSPVVIAVDDIQWLDLPTWHVIEFALRRLDAEPVGLLGAQRVEDGGARPDLGALPRERLREVRLGPVSLAALHEIVRMELGRSFARPTLVRIEATSGGNPFFALELARALIDEGGAVAPTGRLPVPEDLAELLTRRLKRLPAATQRALLIASAMSVPKANDPAIARAVDAGVVRVDNEGRLSFAHPLLAATVYSSAPVAERRRVHRELARVASTDEERAHHLALAAEAPDESVARALVSAARVARERGAPDAAVELLAHAYDLTPPADPEARFARKFELGRTIASSGDPQRARVLLPELIGEARPGTERAHVILLLSFLTDWTEGGEAGTAMCETALVEAGTDDALRAEIHASASRMCDHDPARKAYHARTALELASRPGIDPRLRSYALLAHAEAEFYVGHGLATHVLDEAAALEASAPPWDPDPLRRPSHTMHLVPDVTPSSRLRGILAIYDDDLDAAREAAERDRRGSIEYGDEVQLARALGRLATIEMRAGDWPRAERHLRDLDAVVQRTSLAVAQHRFMLLRTQLDALTGRIETARATGDRALQFANERSWTWETCESRAARGFVELVAGDHAAAREQFDIADAVFAKLALGDPGFIRYHADRIEALIGVGALDEAEGALEPFAARARSIRRATVLANAERCRALLAAARGDLDGAVATIDAAVTHHATRTLPLELGRTLLAKGQIHRRRKEKGKAREALEAALAIFDRLGAAPWSVRTRAELDRVGLSRRRPDELTSTEQQIASLAASGLTNRVIAERAFLSPKTVEANLARVYEKLRIHSRAELGRAMAQRERAAAK